MLLANLLAYLVLFPKTLLVLTAPDENQTQQDPALYNNSGLAPHGLIPNDWKNLDSWWNMLKGEKIEATTEFAIIYYENFVPESHVNWHLLPPKDKCGISHAQRIIGGSEVAMGSFPWIVRIGYETLERSLAYPFSTQSRISYSCGGSLISKYYVLTAAHCVDNPDEITHVRFGEHNAKSDPDCEMRGDAQVCAPPVQDIKVVKVIRHEKYSDDQNMKNDVALLKLESPPELSQYVQPACLPFGVGMKLDFEDADTTVAGWGLTEKNKLSSILLAVTQKVSNAKTCRRIYRDENAIDINYNEGQMCVGGRVGRDSCGGDSGGPLMYTGTFDPAIGARTYVIGLVSQGPVECGRYEIPGIYTRISFFMPWILDNMEE